MCLYIKRSDVSVASVTTVYGWPVDTAALWSQGSPHWGVSLRRIEPEMAGQPGLRCEVPDWVCGLWWFRTSSGESVGQRGRHRRAEWRWLLVSHQNTMRRRQGLGAVADWWTRSKDEGKLFPAFVQGTSKGLQESLEKGDRPVPHGHFASGVPSRCRGTSSWMVDGEDSQGWVWGL